MDSIALFVLAFGLAMDAFATSICKGLALQKVSLKNTCIIGLWFGGFQALMPIIGYALGIGFQQSIAAIDHWIAAILLGGIGFNMLHEGIKGEDSEQKDESNASLAINKMLPLAIATSIDALAVGVTFAFLNVDIIVAAGSIGIVTFLLSSAGVWLGSEVGSKYEAKAQLIGGIVLIIMGLKILVEHLGFFA